MLTLSELEDQLKRFDTEVKTARQYAQSRLEGIRRAKLGDLNLREDLYQEMKSVFRCLYHNDRFRSVFFRTGDRGKRSRRLLLVFMSELIYWEYETSFWNKLREILELKKVSDDNWFRAQMQRGYQENGITLIRGWGGRREYVRTIIGESGFSRELVQEAKRFVIWFFDHYSNLDPRDLNADSFDRILDNYGIWNKDEMFDLLRNMVGSVSRLLREVRRRSLISVDLRDEDVLTELRETLGFHPVHGVFGFRRSEDIQDLLEQLSARVRPEAFYNMLRRKSLSTEAKLWVIAPDGEIVKLDQPQDLSICFGEYQIITPHRSQIQVVPREALSLGQLRDLLTSPKRTFHQHNQGYAWIHDDEPFEVYHGEFEPDNPYPYRIGELAGYLWYGRQRIGVPLTAERFGEPISNLQPRQDIRLNPRLRLDWQSRGMEVVIPSFVCYEPDFAGRTVRLELNGRSIENTTYVIGQEGSLQFQSTRVAEVLPEDDNLRVSLVAVDTSKTVSEKTVRSSLKQAFLFSKASRELVRPGSRIYGGSEFVLFNGTSATAKIGEFVNLESIEDFGPFEVFKLVWDPEPDNGTPFELQVGEAVWKFEQPFEIDASLYCTPQTGRFSPQEPNSVFDPSDATVSLRFHGCLDHIPEVWADTSLICEKDGEFLLDLSLAELDQMESLQPGPTEGEYQLRVSSVIEYFVERNLTDRRIGSYRWTIVLRTSAQSDLEPLSELEFAVLPGLRVDGVDARMVEGEEYLVAVFCDAPVLINEDDRLTDVMQVSCIPRASYSSTDVRINPQTIQKTIRLAYPPTKVTLGFKPRVSAMRVAYRGKALSRPSLTRTEAEKSQLHILTSPNDDVQVVESGNEIERMKTDENGYLTYPLVNLLRTIRHERTPFEILCGDANWKFCILWYMKFRFTSQECSLRPTSDGKRRVLELCFSLEGPPSTEIVFRMADNRLISHGCCRFTAAELAGGSIALHLDGNQLKEASILYCSAFARDNRLDSVEIPLRHTALEENQPRMSRHLEARIADSDLQELPSLVETLDTIAQSSLARRALRRMYSSENLERVCRDFRKGQSDSDEVARYFEPFEAGMLPDLHRMSIPLLKKCCAIPVPKLQSACAERLLLRGDGWGVDVITGLMKRDQLTWEEGVDILHKNDQSSSEVIRDMVKWDELELEDERSIELMERLSRVFHPPMARRARAARDWKRAIGLHQQREVITVKAIGSNSKGLRVSFGLIFGQIPVEEIDLHHSYREMRRIPHARLEERVGKTISVVVVEVDRKRGRLLLSEKRAKDIVSEQLLDDIEPGSRRTGRITNLCDFGAFVDLGGIDGLIHISEMTWGRIGHPREVASVDEQVEVLVLSVDVTREEIKLSLKRLRPDPRMLKAQDYEVGQVVQARVTKVADYGVFVSIEAGLDGFVHRSELSHRRVSHPSDVVEEGEKLKLRVLRIDEDKRRLVLSRKQVGEDDLYWGKIRVRTD